MASSMLGHWALQAACGACSQRDERHIYAAAVGRQFSIITAPPDIALLCDEVRGRGGSVAEILSTGPDHAFVAMPLGRSGLIVPPADLRNDDRYFVPTRGHYTTRTLSSQVIELTAGRDHDTIPGLRVGRLWFSTCLGFEGDNPVRPDPSYVKWCEALYRWVKTRWSLDGARRGDYWGPTAQSVRDAGARRDNATDPQQS
jgi:hypothetical protein